MPSAANQNIWKQMNYTPPRGPCNHKESLLSPKCPCLRFMMHPLKVTSSFSCDGCSHHASFHSMSSPADDAVLARWTTAESQSTTTTTTNGGAPPASPRSRKRPRRAIEAGPSSAIAATAPSITSTEADTPSSNIFDGAALFSEDVEWVNGAGVGSDEGGGGGGGFGASRHHERQGSKTWGDRFSSWSFGRAAAEEPVKTPPKRVQQAQGQSQGSKKKGGGGGGGGASGNNKQRRRQQQRDDQDEEVRVGEVVDLD